MTISEALRAFLLAQPSIAALVGTRIYPQVLPQKPAYPAITYAQVSGIRVRGLDGPTGRARPRIAVNSWGASHREMDAVASAVRAALDGYAGPMGDLVVDSAVLDNEIEFFEEDAGVHRKLQDYIISHEET
jgi:hypothetical protein